MSPGKGRATDGHTATGNTYEKFREVYVVFEIYDRTDRHTDTLIAILRQFFTRLR